MRFKAHFSWNDGSQIFHNDHDFLHTDITLSRLFYQTFKF